MPKVSKEYIAAKKKEIIDAAIRVCKSKPAYYVTIRDVIKECGISQGGMYHYFSSIDEIFAEILNRAYGEMNFASEAEKIFDSGRQPSDIIMDSLMLVGDMLDSLYDRFGKLIFELEVRYSEKSDGQKKMREMFAVNSDAQTIVFKVNSLIKAHIADGHFKCSLPSDYITFLPLALLEGAKRISLVSFSNPGALEKSGLLDKEHSTVRGMMKNSAEIIIKLLNT